MSSSSENYHFEKRIRTVAIIGAGPTGLPAARQLRDAGLDVTVFDRQDAVGGLWNWQEETTGPLAIPTPPPSIGAFTPISDDTANGRSGNGNGFKPEAFNPPNPCYWNLTNNVPTKTMAFKDFPYPADTPDCIPHYELAAYLHSYARHFDLAPSVKLSTRVEKVQKTPSGQWELTLQTQGSADSSSTTPKFWTQSFDGVVVATGHYTAPFIPNIPGAGEWYNQYRAHIIHSQGYRRPETYAGKRVLIIGAGTSGMDIARDLSDHVESVIISSRIDPTAPSTYQNFRRAQSSRAPPKGEKVGAIKAFRVPPAGSSMSQGEIEIEDGLTVTGIDAIIWCTGYQYSYPFLSQYHNDTHVLNDLDDETKLVEKGDQVFNLYRDVFYIPDPTLTFIGISVNTSAFSFFEYQSISIARVFSGRAQLPSQPEQRRILAERIAKKGRGKFRHFMGQEGEREYVRDTVEWINRDAEVFGAQPIEGHSKEWLWESDQVAKKIAAKYGLDLEVIKGLSDLTGNADVPEVSLDRVPKDAIRHEEGFDQEEFGQRLLSRRQFDPSRSPHRCVNAMYLLS